MHLRQPSPIVVATSCLACNTLIGLADAVQLRVRAMARQLRHGMFTESRAHGASDNKNQLAGVTLARSLLVAGNVRSKQVASAGYRQQLSAMKLPP